MFKESEKQLNLTLLGVLCLSFVCLSYYRYNACYELSNVDILNVLLVFKDPQVQRRVQPSNKF